MRREAAKLASFGAAIAVGCALAFLATIVTGVLAAVPVPMDYWSALKPIPGLAVSLYGTVITCLVIAVVAITCVGLVRAIPHVSSIHVLVCGLAVLLFAMPDLPVSASLLWPRNGPPNVFIMLNVLISFCALPLAVWLGYRFGRRAQAG